MKRLKELFYCALATLMFTGCQSYKKVPYLQDAEVVLYSTQNEQLYDAKIMPKDLLTIVVSCTSPELAAPFNLTVATQNNAALSYTTTQPVLQQYLVDNDGNINFPVLGELHVGGLTKKGVDCSGFVAIVFREVYGKQLARSSADMLKHNCKKVSRANLKEGDLVFFRTGKGRKKVPNHVGIYLKNGKFIHTSTSNGVIVSSLSEPYYVRTWLTGGRVKNL